MALVLQSVFGFIVLYAFAWLISEKRRVIQWRTVFGAIILQVIMFVLLFKFPYFKEAAAVLNDALNGVRVTCRWDRVVLGSKHIW